MLIGVPKEIKVHEYRVGLVPGAVRELVARGHEVIVERGAGAGIGATDAQYESVGATLIMSASDVWRRAEMIVKVKEPQPTERSQLYEGQILFTFLHLAADARQTKDLMESGATCIAYETVTSSAGGLPLLAPMSEVAGRMSIQAGAHFLEKAQGGLGLLLGGVPGVERAKVVVLGGGIVGTHAIQIALGMGADVWVIERNPERLKSLARQFGNPLNTAFSTRESLEKHVVEADLVIGGVLMPGAAAPRIVTAEMVRAMKPGAVVVDVAIDQGGCFETSRPTTHDKPTYVVDDVIHYCVANMPGGVPRTSTFALNNATLPFVLAIAEKGAKDALLQDSHFCAGLNVHGGHLTHQAVAEALKYPSTDPRQALLS